MWSYILASANLLGVFLIARKMRAGWFVAFAANVGWMVYGYHMHLGGIVVSGFVYLYIHVNAIRKWS